MAELKEEDINYLNRIVEETYQQIPENSPSILVDETTSRFSDAEWFEKVKEKDITIAGLGGIGSWAAFMIAKTNPRKLEIFDPDTVEHSNIGGQFYREGNVGDKKATALALIIGMHAHYFSIFAHDCRFGPYTQGDKIMICGFDNMKSRKEYFENWCGYLLLHKEIDRKDCLFIDGRLAAEEYQVYCIRGDDEYNIEEYKKTLFSDEEVPDAPCSYKQTAYCAQMIGSVITNLFLNFCANQCNPLIERDLPFLTTYDAKTMFFKTKA